MYLVDILICAPYRVAVIDSDPSYYLVDVSCSVPCCCQSDRSSHRTTWSILRSGVWTVP